MHKLKLFLLSAVLFTACSAAAQNIRVDGIVQARSGQPAAGAFVAVCTQSAAGIPAPTSPTPCAALAQLCTSVADLTCNSANPVTSDGLGNYHFYVKIFPSTYYSLQFFGPSLTTGVLPDQLFGGGSGGSSGNATFLQGVPINPLAPSDGQVLAYSATLGMWTPSTGGGGSGWPTTSMPVPTGSALFPTGTGQVQATSFAILNSAALTPSGAASSTCPGPVFGWLQNAAGVPQTQYGIDNTWTVNGDSSFPGGLVVCRPILFNSTGVANPAGGRNGHAFNVYDNFSNSPDHHFAIQFQYENSVSDSATYTSPNIGMLYGDFEINGTPTLNTTFVSTLRFRNDDNRTGGGKPRVWSVYQGETNKTAAHDITNCAGVGIDGFTTGAPCYSIFWGETGATLSSNEDQTGVTYDTYSGGTKDIGAHALNATGNVFHALVQVSTGNRLPNSNGFTSEDFGTASGYFNFLSKGVNSAGASSGFNAFVGPTALGQSIHAAAGYELDVLGAVKIKAAAGVNDLCFFGSTSGQVCLLAAASAGSSNFTLPTADGSSGWSLVTDGAGHLSFANIAGGGGSCSGTCITAINGQAGPILTFNTAAGTNVALTVNSAANVITYSGAITGRIPPANLDTTVFVACTTTTKILCTPGTQTFALSLSSVWAATDLNDNVLQAVTNDTNICGSVGSGVNKQTLILGWQGSGGCNSGTATQLSTARGGFGPVGTVALNQIAVGTASGVFTLKTLTNGPLSFDNTTQTFSTFSALSNPMNTLGDMITGGASGTPTRLAGPTTPNGVAYTMCSTPAAGVATAPAWCLGGVTGRTFAGNTSDPIVVTDRTSWVVYTNNGSTVPVPLPGAGTSGFASNYSYRAIVQGTSPMTITPAAGLINGGATFTMNQGENCLISTLDNTNYTTACSPGQLTAGTGIGFTRSASGLTISATSVGTPSNVTSQSASQTAVTVGAGLTPGMYTIKYNANLNTACSTGGNSVNFTFNWTDAGAARSLTTGNLSLAAGSPSSSAYLEGVFVIWVGSSNVTYTSTVSGACATGTSTYDVHVAVAP